MENCLGGSKRTIRAQRDLQQLKQQCQQQPPNQNFYTQQQPQVHRQTVQTIKQQQQQLQQQLLQQQQHHQHQQRLLQEEQQLQKVATQLLHQQQQQQQHQQQQQQLQQLIHPLQQLTLQQHQLQKQLQQQQQREIAYQLGLSSESTAVAQELESEEEHHTNNCTTATTPKFGASTNCLHFPPPPDYPPPPSAKTQTSTAGATTTATTASTAALCTTASTKTMSTPASNAKSAMSSTPTTPASTTTTTPVASKGNGSLGGQQPHNAHQHQHQYQQQQQHLQCLYEEQQQQLLHEHHQQLLHEYEQQQLEEQLQQLHLPITNHYPRQQQHQQQHHNYHPQQLTDHVLTHGEPMAPPAVSPATHHSSNVTANNAHTNNNNNHHHHQHNNHHHHQHHRHHSSASSSPSTSSATSGNTIGMSPYGRRHVLPRYPDPDPDAIEVCNELEPMNGSAKGSTRSKTLGRHNKEHFNSSSSSANSEAKWSTSSSVQQTTSLQLLHQQQQHSSSHSITHSPHAQHDYSYAYYEPGAAMRHSNIPTPEMLPGGAALQLGGAQGGGLSGAIGGGIGIGDEEPPPPPNSIRALLSMGMKKKMLTSPAARHAAYQQAQKQHKQQQQLYGFDADIACDNGASMRSTNSENFYEEISSNEAALQYHYKTYQHHAHQSHQLRPSVTSHSAGSLNQSLVEEELRRVHSHHNKILGELNLSVEAMLMPESPPSHSPNGGGGDAPTVSVTSASGKPNRVRDTSINVGASSSGGAASCSTSASLRLSSTSSANNICDASLSELLNTVGPTDELPSPVQSSTNAAFCAADLDSGFSGSSGASYIGSLRIHKTNAALSHIMSTRQQTHSPSGAGGCSAANSCNFPSYGGTQSCRSFQRSASTKQPPQHHQLTILDDDLNAGFLTRASCGRRILNCAKIRAAEDPGPVVPSESKARSFWNSKGWRKLPGFSTSTSSINDTGSTVAGEPIPMRNLNGGNQTSTIATTGGSLTAPTTADTATRTKTKTKETATSTKAIPLICLKR